MWKAWCFYHGLEVTAFVGLHTLNGFNRRGKPSSCRRRSKMRTRPVVPRRVQSLQARLSRQSTYNLLARQHQPLPKVKFPRQLEGVLLEITVSFLVTHLRALAAASQISGGVEEQRYEASAHQHPL